MVDLVVAFIDSEEDLDSPELVHAASLAGYLVVLVPAHGPTGICGKFEVIFYDAFGGG